MLRLPHNRKTRIQFALVTAFLLTFYFGVRYAANWIEGGADVMEFRNAISRGDLDALEHLIEAGMNVNARVPAASGARETPLHIAVERGNRAAAELLLENGADPNAVTHYGQTPLHIVASSDADLTRLLLNHGATADVYNHNGESPLYSAAKSGRMEIVQLLVEHGAPLHGWSENWQSTPALAALRDGHVDIARYILFDAGKGDLSAEKLDLLLEAAASTGDADLVRTFLEAGATAPKQPFSEIGPLLGAIRSGSLDGVRALIEYGFEPSDYQGREQAILMTAAGWSDNPDIVILMLDDGLSPNLANRKGETALHAAAQVNATASARILIERGADVNAQTDTGGTPIYAAVQYSSVEVLQLFLEVGADPSIPDAFGKSPLTLALEKRSHAENPDVPDAYREKVRAVVDILQKVAARAGADTN